MTQEDCRDAGIESVKLKACLKFHTVREVKGFHSSIRSTKIHVGTMMNGAGDTVKKDKEKAKLHHVFFTSVSTGKS